MYQRDGIQEGMIVRSIDGHRLGKVYAVGEDEFHIEKGLFFPKDYSVRYAEVSDVKDGEIFLAHGKESLRPFSTTELYGDARSIDPLDSGRAAVATRPVERDISWRTESEYEALPMDRRIDGLRTEDLGDQEIGAHNTEGARASPLLTEEDRARVIPPPRAPERPVMRATSEPSELGVVEDELYEDTRRREVRGDADLDSSRKFDLSGERDPKKRGW